MKKVLAMSLAIIAGTSSLWAAGNHPMAGCGLGYVLLSNKENNKVMQVLGATTNGTFGSQTFGITSGTSGCTEDGAVKIVKEAEVFAEVNLDSLRQEMAIGDGEFVRAFSTLLGAKDHAGMLQLFRTDYASFFPTSTTTTAEMLAALQQKLAERPELFS